MEQWFRDTWCKIFGHKWIKGYYWLPVRVDYDDTIYVGLRMTCPVCRQQKFVEGVKHGNGVHGMPMSEAEMEEIWGHRYL